MWLMKPTAAARQHRAHVQAVSPHPSAPPPLLMVRRRSASRPCAQIVGTAGRMAGGALTEAKVKAQHITAPKTQPKTALKHSKC